MPHQCTNCGRRFPDGSKQMLSGCPDCGGNKFQFEPKSVASADDSADAPAATTSAAGESPASTGDGPADQHDRPEDGGGVDGDRSGVADTVKGATTTVKDWVGRGSDATTADDESTGSADGADAADRTGGETVEAGDAGEEDAAQATARTDMVTPDEIPDTGESPAERAPPAEGRVASTPDGDDRPDLAGLREELNDQFESIRIVRPGQYEINLMELYDREEYIISLMEDGRYVIEVPDAWRGESE